MGARVVTVNDVLDGHVALDIECLDRIYLNAYVPKLQTSAQVVAFLSGHLGYPFPSPALFNQIGQRFRRAVASFAESNGIPWVKFGKDDVGGKLELMRPHPLRLLGSDYRPNQMTYDLRRLRLAGLIRRLPHTNRYTLTHDSIRIAVFYTKIYNRLLVPLTAADQPQAPPDLRQALHTLDHHVNSYTNRARLKPAA